MATRSRTSCAARVDVAVEVEGDDDEGAALAETERSSLMPSTVLTASSMRCDTSVSTSSGEAPGKVVRTRTVGRSTEGKRSTPSRK